MKLETARMVVANWDTPLSRYFFWYLLIPARLEIQRAEPDRFAYRGWRQIPYRWLYLLRFALAAVLLAALGLPQFGGLPAILLVLLKLVVFYDTALSLIWALAYWAMRESRS
ncbi:hypothetical protein [Chitinilyticum aquatile]|uniref:hypothetical protein n=1 Tax=Chitinilyticum aquatile TaxID=362520 RepID=UPI000427253C|nr:hypothetical protein [Chitinilyticum aquatile]